MYLLRRLAHERLIVADVRLGMSIVRLWRYIYTRLSLWNVTRVYETGLIELQWSIAADQLGVCARCEMLR